MTLSCAVCGLAVTRYRTQLPKAGTDAYCSRACAWAGRRGRHPRKPARACVRCGASFRPLFALQRYCSYACRGRAQQQRDPAVYFWPRVEKTETCWLWRGPLARNGYGRVAFEGAREYAHRVSYILAHGAIADGAHVLHGCDGAYPIGSTAYRACVHPAHLRLGDQRANTRDAVERGRHAHGERQGHARLTDRQVAAIRGVYQAGGITQKQLALVYGVSAGTIQHVVSGASWRRV